MEQSISSTSIYADRVYENEGSPYFLASILGMKVLDVGSGAGGNAKILKSQGCRVWGVTLSKKEAEMAAPHFEKLAEADIQYWTPDVAKEFFDVLLFSHVLEHLSDPSSVLKRLLPYLSPGGKIYIALPNFSYWRVRFRILLGRFEYTSEGILDETHLRFFTPRTARKFIESSDCQIEMESVEGHCPLGVIRRLLPRLSQWLDAWCCRLFPGLFGFHIQIVATKKRESFKAD